MEAFQLYAVRLSRFDYVSFLANIGNYLDGSVLQIDFFKTALILSLTDGTRSDTFYSWNNEERQGKVAIFFSYPVKFI